MSLMIPCLRYNAADYAGKRVEINRYTVRDVCRPKHFEFVTAPNATVALSGDKRHRARRLEPRVMNGHGRELAHRSLERDKQVRAP